MFFEKKLILAKCPETAKISQSADFKIKSSKRAEKYLQNAK